VLPTGHDLAGDRPVAGDRHAQVAVHGAPDPHRELLRQRPVEAVELTQLRLQVGRRVRRQDRHQRIARRQVHEQKAHERHADHDRHGVDHTAEKVGEHGWLGGWRWLLAAWSRQGRPRSLAFFVEHRGTGFAGPLVLPPRGGIGCTK